MLYLIIPSLIWAFSYGLIKSQLTNLDPNFVAFLRLTIASLVFLPFIKLQNIKVKQIIQLMLIGLIQYGIMYMAFLKSFQYLDAYQAALFTTVTPIYVIIINDLLNRKLNLYYAKVALLAVFGGIVIYYKNINAPNILSGLILVQISDICFAFGQVAYKKFREQNKSVEDKNIYSWLFIGASMGALSACTLSGGWQSINIISTQQIATITYLGLIASGFGFFMWNFGATKTNYATLAVFNNLKMPLAITVSLTFFGESTNILRLAIGMTLIAAALYLAESHNKKHLSINAT